MPECAINIQLSEFALKLRKYLFSQGLSFEAFSKQVGVREERLRLFILDKAEPTHRERKKIAKVIPQQKIALPK